MQSPPEKTAAEHPGGDQQDGSARAAMEMEMRTRDADALYYEEFFTDFQNAVEMKTYAGAFSGATSQRALEVGCGTGRTLRALSSRATVGIDLSRQELLVARRRFGPDVTLVQASATHLPFREGAFDQLLCAGVLLHLPNEETRALTVKEMARVLARPARIVVAAHNYSWVVQRMFPKEVVNHNLFWHRFTVGEMEALLHQALAPCCVTTRAICHLPRWRIGNRLGRFGVWLDGILSHVPGLKHLTGAILVAEVDALPKR